MALPDLSAQARTASTEQDEKSTVPTHPQERGLSSSPSHDLRVLGVVQTPFIKLSLLKLFIINCHRFFNVELNFNTLVMNSSLIILCGIFFFYIHKGHWVYSFYFLPSLSGLVYSYPGPVKLCGTCFLLCFLEEFE
jgi:hypothetical protein